MSEDGGGGLVTVAVVAREKADSGGLATAVAVVRRILEMAAAGLKF